MIDFQGKSLICGRFVLFYIVFKGWGFPTDQHSSKMMHNTDIMGLVSSKINSFL